MTLKDIFKKPVDRAIEGVIKADDDASLRLELEEYVLTNEVEKRLEAFLDAYNNYEGANGVWVSGFFGSGKSHLLKMLALLLENRSIDGTAVLDLFLPKCGDNEILRGDLKRAVTIPSKSILFNIDQKADVISKTQIDALLAVFVKVFDEMCGYYGKQGHIAQFERDLDSRDLYEEFKSAYEITSGRGWQTGREQALLEAKNIAKAYAQVTGEDEQQSLGILDKYRSQYRVSIEDFAEQVHQYIERQSKLADQSTTGKSEFRLNFFVDEVGQYIAENVKLMTNLQTIAESLATKCRGRAWVIVTAQEDMGSVVGEMGKQQGNDFSKIQARFANRMKLTSADVSEVIQKRLLMKTNDGVRMLSDIHHAQANNFKTLFDFADGSQTYRNFQDREHFIDCYPFIPYQFSLFQSAIQNLSQHNAFEGKHSSVGERSMLGVFQQVAIQIGQHEIGQLATFDLMFQGIRTALKANIQRSIIRAEKHLDNPFAIRLLKALFLVKYVKEFKPTLRNLCILMLEDFQADLPGLKKRVEESLGLLENQTYIQRNGELFEYLTDEEKDVEQEIKNTEVESTDVADELEKIIFDHVIKHRKIRYENPASKEPGQDYPFSRKLDDRLHGREHELGIHIVSPFHENSDNEAILRMQSMGRDELIVIMPADDRLVRDILMYKRTERYIRQNISITQQEAVKRILNDKGFQNQERYAELQQRVKALLGKAKLIVAAAEIEIGSEDAQSRIIRGFQELIARTYPNLKMLRGIQYREENIKTILTSPQSDIYQLAESEQELLAHINSNSRGGVRTTMKSLLEKFERKNYGWPYAAILCTLASLCARGKVEVRSDGNLLEDEELERALRNSHNHINLVLEPQVEFTASQVRSLKTFFEDFFDKPPRATEAKALGKEMGTALAELHHRLTPLAAQAAQYPFLNGLAPVIERLKASMGKPYTWYLTEFSREEDELLDLKENIIDPLQKFMSGAQKTIFDEAQNFVRNQQPNFAYLPGDDAQQLIDSLNDKDCFKGNRMQQNKGLLEQIKKEVDDQIQIEIMRSKEACAALQKRIEGLAEFNALDSDKQQQIIQPFTAFANQIERQNLIAVIRDTLRCFEETEYQHCLSQMANWAQPEPSPIVTDAPTDNATKASRQKPMSNKANDREGVVAEPVAAPKPAVEYIPSRAVAVSFDKAWLADENDVERYLSAMREALLEHIRQGKRIQI